MVFLYFAFMIFILDTVVFTWWKRDISTKC